MVSGNGDFPVREMLRISKQCEDNGFSGIWIGETTVRDASVMATLACLATEKIGVGTSIVNVYTRSPGQLAMMASTLNSLSNGRFTLGLGSSTEAIVSGWHGVAFQKPVQRVEEVVRLLRLYFSGERFGYKGENYSPSNARLRTSGRQMIALAALNRNMLSKASLLADKVVVNMYPPRMVGEALEVVNAAAGSRQDSTRPKLSVVLYSHVLGASEQALENAKELLAFYGSSQAYSKLFAHAGFSSEAHSMLEAWQRNDRVGAKTSATEQMIHDLLLLGDISTLVERLEEYRRAGVDEVIIAPFPFGEYIKNIHKVASTRFV